MDWTGKYCWAQSYSGGNFQQAVIAGLNGSASEHVMRRSFSHFSSGKHAYGMLCCADLMIIRDIVEAFRRDHDSFVFDF